MRELTALAQAKGVPLTVEDMESTISLLSNFPYHSKPSFQLDVEKGNSGEKATLLDDVINKLQQAGLSAVHYQRIGQLIESKI